MAQLNEQTKEVPHKVIAPTHTKLLHPHPHKVINPFLRGTHPHTKLLRVHAGCATTFYPTQSYYACAPAPYTTAHTRLGVCTLVQEEGGASYGIDDIPYCREHPGVCRHE